MEVPAIYYWCLHCEQAFTRVEWVIKKWNCPNPGCDGSILDAHPWKVDGWPRDLHPEYPDRPERGVIYPLYKS